MTERRIPSPSDFSDLLRFRRPTLDVTARRLANAHTIADLRTIAQRVTPRAPFDYTDGAAEAELSLARARQAFLDIEFHPAILRDVSVVDTWYPLTLGAHVHLSPAVLLPGGVLGTIQRERVTHMAAVGSTLSLLAQRGRGLAAYDLSSLRRIMTGAEVLNPATVATWLAAAPRAIVVNGYGPTEATCLVLAHEIDAAHADPDAVVPIGRELPGTTVRFLLDESGAVAPSGPGEILIAGPQVMTGYHGRADLDSVAFLHVGDRRYYRTGDFGRRDGQGVVWFDGRRDEQVKIGGHRVDLGEVRATLESHPGVVSALVWPEEDSRGKEILIASVEIRGDASTTTTDESLLGRCRERLPAHMVPSWITVQAAFPRLSSGKVDVVAVRAATRAAGAEEAA